MISNKYIAIAIGYRYSISKENARNPKAIIRRELAKWVRDICFVGLCQACKQSVPAM